MNNFYHSSLRDHYHQPELISRILKALEDSGFDLGNLRCEDLQLLDEFHIRGQEATMELANLCSLQENQVVLDLGCGIGGPARFLARKFGCRVHGLDLVESYLEAAAVLTEMTGMEGRVSFRQGDMREMPFSDASFHRVWSQHTVMNIADKAALAAEVRRVLRPGGKAAFYEVCSTANGPVHLPVPWAGNNEDSHLCSAPELREFLKSSGLVEDFWEDVTALSISWLDKLVASLKQKPKTTGTPPGLGLLMGAEAGLKSRNLGRNLREGRIVVVRGVFSRID